MAVSEGMARLLWVTAGSAVGGGARYLLVGWVTRLLGPGFPYGTLAVNLLGSLLLGVVMGVAEESAVLSQTARLALSAGVLGGFTTYSSFSFETLRHAQEGRAGIAALNVVLTVLGCLGACLLGWQGAKWATG